ncbi:MAG TPA: hypothetical protein VF940_05965 [Streptosporangiaceae bacterium]
MEQRPDLYAAWVQLNSAIRAGTDLRRWELATTRRLRSSYCCLAHRTALAERSGGPAAQIAIDHRAAGPGQTDVVVMDLAEPVTDDATSVTERELQRLRDLGQSQEAIIDVVLAAAARCFFSTTLDASLLEGRSSPTSSVRGISRPSPRFRPGMSG